VAVKKIGMNFACRAIRLDILKNNNAAMLHYRGLDNTYFEKIMEMDHPHRPMPLIFHNEKGGNRVLFHDSHGVSCKGFGKNSLGVGTH
jgi:hypothetical protein